MYTALPLPTRYPIDISLMFLLILATGKTNPALKDFEFFPPPPKILDLLTPFAPVILGTGNLEIYDFLLDFLESLLTTFLAGETTGGDGKMGGRDATAGTGALLSKRLSGTLETVCTIEALLYASLPPLSRVSRMVRVGNIEKI